ncbi:hypothetical protein DFQ28_008855 [Apophysomyces sp. BC1034]|nr:hypothetical protein DFQ29_005739 [Apophysomyces sp. BC1021]KAG0194596.1 hypothetical protein DFQ28_008855 [Apophysomyces sp. BC1034]
MRGMALGRHLASHDQLELKTVVASKGFQILPSIFQKYVVKWSAAGRGKPWYLETPDKDSLDGPSPDYVVCSGSRTVSACLHIMKSNASRKMFSVFAGYPDLPFINFDQVILPKYEANAKLAKLGPLARQNNCIITNTPLLGSAPVKAIPSGNLQAFTDSSPNLTAVVIGGHAPQCRWYSEDAASLADTMRRMVSHLDTRLAIVFTDRTSPLVKEAIRKGVESINNSVEIWDFTNTEATTAEKLDIYESIIQNAKRVILTADLDYATAHAASNRKPVYIAFGGRCRSYLLHFQRWARESRLTRKLRLDRTPRLQPDVDPYSYLGKHLPWADGWRVLEVDSTMAHVGHEIQAIRSEKVTGKRRKDA